jgi:hypothetical protein
MYEEVEWRGCTPQCARDECEVKGCVIVLVLCVLTGTIQLSCSMTPALFRTTPFPVGQCTVVGGDSGQQGAIRAELDGVIVQVHEMILEPKGDRDFR